MGLVAELRRRNVFRMLVLYALAAWLIMQVAEVVIGLANLPDWVGPSILVLLAIGCPIALIFSWFYELTPEGISRDKDVARAEPDEPGAGRRLDFLVISLLGAAVILFAWDKWWVSDPPDRSVAVLPLANISAYADNDYFSDGLTEAMLHRLARLPGLKVSARTSVFFFKDKDVEAREIAAKLGVAHLLTGSVQRDANRVRIVVRLIDAESGASIWSSSYDRDLSDIFAVQDDIAFNVASALRVALLGGAPGQRAASAATKNAQAYEKFLQALEQKHISSYRSLPVAEGLFKEALSLDPGFTGATVELAKTYALQQETGMLSYQEAEAEIRPLLNQVLSRDPGNGQALGMLARLDWPYAALEHGQDSDPVRQIEARLRHAIELVPSDPDLYVTMAEFAENSGRFDEAHEWLGKGLSIDPLSARLHLAHGRVDLLHRNRPEEAAATFAIAHELLPEWPSVMIFSGDAALAMGKIADGIEWYLHAMSVDPQDHELPAEIASVYYQLGLLEEGDAMLRQAQALAPREILTRSAELERHLLTDNHEHAVAFAAEMIRDRIENRGGAFDFAVSGYVSSMIELGRAGLVAEFFESVQPGIADLDYEPRGAIDSSLQFFLAMALLETGDYDAAETKMAKVVELADKVVPGWRQYDDTMAVVAIAQGDRDAAARHALADMSQAVGRRVRWNINYRHMAWMKPLRKDPRIARRMEELDSQVRDAAAEVREMLETRREIASPPP